MLINKFKKIGKSKYKIYFDNTEIILYEDVILKYNLLCNNNIDIHLLEKIIEDNRYYEAYYMSINYIDIKMRSKKEIIDYLTKKEFDNKYIDFTVEKLDKLGLLNAIKYIESYINDKINLSNDGPFKIKRNLLELDFNEDDIDNYLNKIDNSIWKEKLIKLIDKKKSIMKSKSYIMFVNKMKYDMFNMGYDKDDIDEILSKVDYESDALEKEIIKANKKYKGDKKKIISSLLRKGYSYEEINNAQKKYE